MSDLLFPWPLILLGCAAGGGSPGQATLAISSTIARGYVRLKRVFDLTFSVLLGAASLKPLTTKLTP